MASLLTTCGTCMEMGFEDCSDIVIPASFGLTPDTDYTWFITTIGGNTYTGTVTTDEDGVLIIPQTAVPEGLFSQYSDPIQLQLRDADGNTLVFTDANGGHDCITITFDGEVDPPIPIDVTGGLFWKLDGNDLSTMGEKWIGTISQHDFPQRTGGIEHWRLKLDGSITRDGVFYSMKYGINTSWGANAGLDAASAATTNFTAVGYNSGLHSLGTGCSWFGSLAGSAVGLTGINNSGFGHGALFNLTGSSKENSAKGYTAGLSLRNGIHNTFDGALAGRNFFSGLGLVDYDGGTFIGAGAGDGVGTGGSWNVFVGHQIGKNTGSNSANIIIGNGIEQTTYTNGNIIQSFSANSGITGSVLIGHLGTITAANQMVIGSVAHFINQEQHFWSATGVHGVFYRTTTPEGVQAAQRGSVCFVDDGATGEMYLKVIGIDGNGWKKVVTL